MNNSDDSFEYYKLLEQPCLAVSEPDNTSVYLRSIKIKDQDRNGKRGTAELFYNKERYMFYDAHNQQPFAREESVSDPVILDMASKGRELIEEFDITNQLFE